MGTRSSPWPGVDVTSQLRSEEAGAGASRVAAWPPLKDALLARQHAFAAVAWAHRGRSGHGHRRASRPPTSRSSSPRAPMNGRKRRYKQLKDKGSGVSLAALSREIAERDLRDSTRAVAPLKPAPDADGDRLDGPDHRAGRSPGAGAGTRTLALGVTRRTRCDALAQTFDFDVIRVNDRRPARTAWP